MLQLVEAIIAQGTEVENTTTEGALASYTFPAGFWIEGKVVDISGSCVVNDNNSTDTLTPRLRFGANAAPASNTQIAAGAAVDVEDSDFGTFQCTLSCRESTDDPTAVEIVADGYITTVDAAPTLTPFHTVLTAVDTLADTYFQYSAEWSVAHADNEAAADSFVVRELA